jgi:UDP-N-acetyl-D-galactosamine dehydrogenase
LPKVNKGKHYQAVIAAVSHKEFFDFDFAHFKENGAVIFDVKNFVPREVVDARL